MRAIANTKTAEANLHSWLGRKQLGQQTTRLIGGLAVGISLSLMLSSKAEAASFNFTQIAESSTTFGSFSTPSLNDSGRVAFSAIAHSNLLLQKFAKFSI